jgi:TonB-linked SusC/RagA family outer membrane protein
MIQAQNRQNKGQVTDSTGAVVAGASITVRGTTRGVRTDSTGSFTITVPGSPVLVQLVITHINYAAKTVPVTGNEINITLSREAAQLEDVIVVGYGTQKKKELTGSIATLNTSGIDERPVSRIDQALVGQMSGVQVKQTSGAPGKPFSINIRGTGSISAGNEPLYVIDGFPVTTTGQNSAGNFSAGSPLDNINTNDIESIQVLKDAAAAAIYGSRAANGVVIITTKRGKKGKTQFSFNAYTGVSKAGKEVDMLSPEQWINRARIFIDSSWVASGAGRTADQTSDQRRLALGLLPGQVNSTLMYDDRWYQPGHPGLAFIDWQKEAFRAGPFQNYQLAASGGNETSRYYISGNYQNQTGYMLGMDYKSYSVRANIETELAKRLKFGLNLSPSYSVRNDPGVEGKDNILHQLITMTPVQEDTMGKYANAFNNGQYAWSTSTNSGIARLENRIGKTAIFRTLASTYLDFQIIDGLTARTSLNYDNIDQKYDQYRPYYTETTLQNRIAQPNINSSGSYAGLRKQTFVNENTLSYTRAITGGHNISVLAGQSYNFFRTDNVTLASNGGYSSSVPTLNASVNPATGTTTASKSILISYFGRVQYDYQGKYMFSGSMRRDGSSRFGSNYKWGSFPSLALGWRVSEETFMKAVPAISSLKLRASYGLSGNNNIGDYDAFSTLANYYYTFGGTRVTGAGVNTIPNPDLHWEKSATYNYGVDLGLFSNRVNVTFDYYNKKNTDLLLQVPAVSASGFTSYYANVGKVQNKGWELELNTQNLKGGPVQWSTSVNISHNNNKVVSLGTEQQRIEIPVSSGWTSAPFAIMQVGLPMYSIYVVQQNGVLTADDIAKGVAMFGAQKVGDPKYVDNTPDGVINTQDRVIVGQPNPKYTWGITNTVKYKGFDLRVLVQGQNGGKIYSLFGRAVNLTGTGYVQNVLNADVSTRGNYRTNFGAIGNTDWLYSSDYISIRNITLGYDLGKLIKLKGIGGARLYVSAENWFYWDKYDGGYNPEATNAGLSADASYPLPGDYGGLPQAKSLVAGLNITF